MIMKRQKGQSSQYFYIAIVKETGEKQTKLSTLGVQWMSGSKSQAF